MTKSYKMHVLGAKLEEDALPGSIGVGRLTARVATVARRHSAVREDWGKCSTTPGRSERSSCAT